MWLVILSDQLAVSLGRPLPYQQADGTQAPLEATGSEESPPLVLAAYAAQPYSVLASLSGGYPQLRGRLPTRYSPLRHSHQDYIAIALDPVRLACLIHDASVRSEPESNSP